MTHKKSGLFLFPAIHQAIFVVALLVLSSFPMSSHAQPSFPFSLTLSPNGNDVIITMTAPAPNTWIGIGLDGLRMTPNDVIVCQQGMTPRACFDGSTDSQDTPSIDAKQDITWVETFTNGKWTVVITRPRNTNDPAGKDAVISNSTQNFMWGIGTGSYRNQHYDYGSFTYDPVTGTATKVNTEVRISLLIVIAAALFVISVVVGFVATKNNIRFLLHTRLGPAMPHSLMGLESLTEMSMGEVMFVLLLLASIVIAMVSQEFDSGTVAPEGRIWGMCNRILIGIILIPVNRNVNPVTWALGISHDRAVKYHRWAGRLLFVSMTIHFGIMANALGPMRMIEWGTGENPALAGLLCWIFLSIIVILSLEPIRRQMWELFLQPHFMLFIPVIVFACLHDKGTLILVVIFGGLYLVDMVVKVQRLMKPVTCQITSVGGPEMAVRLTLTVPGFTWEPGQYVFLSVGSHMHPFSISNAPYPAAPNMFNLVIRNMGPGTFTDSLCRSVALAPKVEGPIGRLSVPLNGYPAVVIIAGGIGITPMASILDFILQGTYPNIQHVTFVWAVKELPLIHEFSGLLLRAQMSAMPRVSIYVHCTAPGVAPGLNVNTIPLLLGRPNFSHYISQVSGDPAKVLPRVGMYVCGPDPLLVTAINDARSQPFDVDVHHERFYF